MPVGSNLVCTLPDQPGYYSSLASLDHFACSHLQGHLSCVLPSSNGASAHSLSCPFSHVRTKIGEIISYCHVRILESKSRHWLLDRLWDRLVKWQFRRAVCSRQCHLSEETIGGEKTSLHDSSITACFHVPIACFACWLVHRHGSCSYFLLR